MTAKCADWMRIVRRMSVGLKIVLLAARSWLPPRHQLAAPHRVRHPRPSAQVVRAAAALGVRLS
jgi:hypothetical protein